MTLTIDLTMRQLQFLLEKRDILILDFSEDFSLEETLGVVLETAAHEHGVKDIGLAEAWID
jgi:hypothetical protein